MEIYCKMEYINVNGHIFHWVRNPANCASIRAQDSFGELRTRSFTWGPGLSSKGLIVAAASQIRFHGP